MWGNAYWGARYWGDAYWGAVGSTPIPPDPTPTPTPGTGGYGGGGGSGVRKRRRGQMAPDAREMDYLRKQRILRQAREDDDIVLQVVKMFMERVNE